ncbi:hypothetical protein B0H19DRAFT_1252909 [Mycena capillaripes]|nr:hypothetical protein B0H19DRAFT_1252909 [Mycena capillaripes]
MSAASSQTFSSIAGGITDLSAPSTLADPASNPVISDTIPAPVPSGEETASPAKRPVGRPKGSKNKTTHVTLDFNGEKRPVGRPRGSGKKKADPDSPPVKRPVGRPRKDGLPPGSSSKSTYTTLVPPTSDYYRAAQTVAPVNQWVPFPGSISAPPAPVPAPVVDPALERLGRNEWAELAHSKPDDFLHALLTALDAPRSLSVTGPSIEEAFKSHLGSLAPPPSSSAPDSVNGAPAQTIPSLYSILKTFWLPSSPSYFALTASTTRVTPSAHRFLYWDPQPLVFNGIACSTCSQPLANRGRIRSGPLTIHDLAGPFFVIGCAYACSNGHAYASTDAAVRRALPAALEREFPVRLLAGDTGVGPDVWNWQARGVSRALWNLVLGALRAGLARDVILQLVRDVQDGVPESVMKEEETERAAPMEEEEETAEEAAQGQAEGQGDVVMQPSESAEPTVASATQAFNDAWTANSVLTNVDLRNNPYARLTMPMFPQTIPTVSISPYDSAQRKRPYPFGDPDGAANGSGAGSEAAVDGAEVASTSSGPTKTRNPRHCCKCGSQACKGKGGRNFCPNPCMDCGKYECRGRNSRRPDKRCDAGWPEGQPQVQEPPADTV